MGKHRYVDVHSLKVHATTNSPLKAIKQTALRNDFSLPALTGLYVTVATLHSLPILQL